MSVVSVVTAASDAAIAAASLSPSPPPLPAPLRVQVKGCNTSAKNKKSLTI